MIKRDFLRILKTILPFVFIAMLYASFLILEYTFDISPWITRPLFVLSVGILICSFTLHIARLRRRTQKALSSVAQIEDEPISIPAHSGAIIITDLSTLRIWRNQEDFSMGNEDLNFSDLTLTGAKAWEVSQAVGLSTPYVYDIPEEALPEIFKSFENRLANTTRRVKVNIENKRIPHIERAKRALAHGPALFNIKGRVLLSIPAKNAKMVRSWFVNGELDTLDFTIKDTTPSYFKPVGPLAFHSNALVAADASALEDWDSLESRDGLYELAMTGANSENAQEAGGLQVRPGIWRWSDISLHEARLIGAQISILNPAAEWSLSPHGDEYFLASQLSLDPIASRTLPQGSVHAIRMEEKEEALVSLGIDSAGDVSAVRLSFNVDLNDVYSMPRASSFERLLTPLLDLKTHLPFTKAKRTTKALKKSKNIKSGGANA